MCCAGVYILTLLLRQFVQSLANAITAEANRRVGNADRLSLARIAQAFADMLPDGVELEWAVESRRLVDAGETESPLAVLAAVKATLASHQAKRRNRADRVQLGRDGVNVAPPAQQGAYAAAREYAPMAPTSEASGSSATTCEQAHPALSDFYGAAYIDVFNTNGIPDSAAAAIRRSATVCSGCGEPGHSANECYSDSTVPIDQGKDRPPLLRPVVRHLH